MKTISIGAMFWGVAVTICAAGMSVAADKNDLVKRDLGQHEYSANCAVCHGKVGKGDGPYAGLVDTRIADLTVIARKNNGVFPFARVFETIDGTNVIKAHGTRDMPIWGIEFKIKAAEYYRDVTYDDEAYVRARILALTEYIYRLQAK